MKKQLIAFNQDGFEQAKQKHTDYKNKFNELLEEANKLVKIKDVERFEQNPQEFLERAYLEKHTELKGMEVTFEGLILMQQKNLEPFKNAVEKYKAIPASDKREPLKSDFETYTNTDKQAELYTDLNNLRNALKDLKTKYGINVHSIPLMQAIPNVFVGFEYEVNSRFILEHN